MSHEQRSGRGDLAPPSERVEGREAFGFGDDIVDEDRGVGHDLDGLIHPGRFQAPPRPFVPDGEERDRCAGRPQRRGQVGGDVEGNAERVPRHRADLPEQPRLDEAPVLDARHRALVLDHGGAGMEQVATADHQGVDAIGLLPELRFLVAEGSPRLVVETHRSHAADRVGVGQHRVRDRRSSARSKMSG